MCYFFLSIFIHTINIFILFLRFIKSLKYLMQVIINLCYTLKVEKRLLWSYLL